MRYNQTAPTPSPFPLVDQVPKDAARKSIERVDYALDKVFADARSRQVMKQTRD
jgi:hypothetical protein